MLYQPNLTVVAGSMVVFPLFLRLSYVVDQINQTDPAKKKNPVELRCYTSGIVTVAIY